MATINRAAIAAAQSLNLWGEPPSPAYHAQVNTCLGILEYLGRVPDADAAQISHHCRLNRETTLQYTQVLAGLGLIEIETKGQGAKNLYRIKLGTNA